MLPRKDVVWKNSWSLPCRQWSGSDSSPACNPQRRRKKKDIFKWGKWGREGGAIFRFPIFFLFPELIGEIRASGELETRSFGGSKTEKVDSCLGFWLKVCVCEGKTKTKKGPVRETQTHKLN